MTNHSLSHGVRSTIRSYTSQIKSQIPFANAFTIHNRSKQPSTAAAASTLCAHFTTTSFRPTSSRQTINKHNNKQSISIPFRTIKVLKSIAEVRQTRLELASHHSKNDSNQVAYIGLVPTMGALHQGHLDLVNKSRNENDFTIVSIFINPLQFAASEDLQAYPRQLDKDLDLLAANKVDYVFMPDENEIYNQHPKHSTIVDVCCVHQTEESKVRPHHFKGVATICLKLFNIIQPHRAYFGQKDGVQCIVLRNMVHDLNVPIQVETCPTTREPDGLAMSSRNIYLTKDERKVAPIIYQSLTAAYKLYNEQGVADVNRLKSAIKAILDGHDNKTEKVKMEIQYISICNTLTGAELDNKIGEGQLGQHMSALISVAVKIGKIRLIDNVIIGPRIRTSLD